MNFKTVLLSLLLPASLGIKAQQKLSIENVYRMSLRNAGPIVTNEEVKGYYSFYMSDKIDRKTNEYTLQLVDVNLNKLNDIKFQDSRSVTLLESSFNDNSIIFMFYNNDNNSVDYRMYNMEGKQTFTYSKPLDKRSEQFFRQAISFQSNEETENQNLFDIPGKGFITVTPLREGRNYTYDVTFFSSEKRRTWTYNPVEDGRVAQAQFLGASDSVAVLEVLTRPKLMSQKTESSLVGINLFNGRKVFEVNTIDGPQQLYPVNITVRRGANSFLLMGPYYGAQDNVVKDKSTGIGVWEMNNQGRLIRSKYNSWAQDMSKFLSVDRKGRVADMGYVYFHSLQQTADGKLFAIGEGYKKIADGVGIAANILAGGHVAGATKMRITDMLMLQFDGAFNLVGADVYDKNSNNFSLATASDYLSPHAMAMMAKAMGAFDYSFTQQNASHTSFTSAYTDYERTKDYKGLTFNTLTYYDGKVSRDKINLKTSATSLAIMPSRSGSVLVLEYFRKDKRLDMHIEKIN